jgi:hypothetical protein
MRDSKRIITAINRAGGEPRDFRDGIHEAYHAVECGLRVGAWDRENVHRALLRRGPGMMVASEISARAVERILCRRFGVEIDEEGFAAVAAMEALKNGIAVPGDAVKWWKRAIRNAEQAPSIIEQSRDLIARLNNIAEEYNV